jgi:hypothetical protein
MPAAPARSVLGDGAREIEAPALDELIWQRPS